MDGGCRFCRTVRFRYGERGRPVNALTKVWATPTGIMVADSAGIRECACAAMNDRRMDGWADAQEAQASADGSGTEAVQWLPLLPAIAISLAVIAANRERATSGRMSTRYGSAQWLPIVPESCIWVALPRNSSEDPLCGPPRTAHR